MGHRQLLPCLLSPVLVLLSLYHHHTHLPAYMLEVSSATVPVVLHLYRIFTSAISNVPHILCYLICCPYPPSLLSHVSDANTLINKNLLFHPHLPLFPSSYIYASAILVVQNLYFLRLHYTTSISLISSYSALSTAIIIFCFNYSISPPLIFS